MVPNHRHQLRVKGTLVGSQVILNMRVVNAGLLNLDGVVPARVILCDGLVQVPRLTCRTTPLKSECFRRTVGSPVSGAAGAV
jgi:hypothetical protein